MVVRQYTKLNYTILYYTILVLYLDPLGPRKLRLLRELGAQASLQEDLAREREIPRSSEKP